MKLVISEWKLSFYVFIEYTLPLISRLSPNVELSIRETARHQADWAVCGHVGISELSLPHCSARYASLSYKSARENMRCAFGNSFSMLSGFFGLTARQSKHNRSASRAARRIWLFPPALQRGRRMEDTRVYLSRKFGKICADREPAEGAAFRWRLKELRARCVSGVIAL